MMKRTFMAVSAAVLLGGILTACGARDTNDYSVTGRYDNTGTSRSGTAAGTSYTMPQRTQLNTGDSRISSSYTMTGYRDSANRNDNHDIGHGKYFANANGSVGRDNETPSQNIRELGQDVTRGVENTVRDTGRIIRNAGSELEY